MLSIDPEIVRRRFLRVIDSGRKSAAIRSLRMFYLRGGKPTEDWRIAVSIRRRSAGGLDLALSIRVDARTFGGEHFWSIIAS